MPGRLARSFHFALILSSGLCAAGCQAASPAAPVAAAAPASGRATIGDTTALGKTGFLRPEERPDAVKLLPPPPAPDSARMAADEVAYLENTRWRGTPRWRLAALDANVQFPLAAGVFACAAGLSISQRATPQLYSLLQRTIIDAGKSTAPAKQRYPRPRPFAVHDAPMCLPEQAAALRSYDAYPSGHASLGWAWALILAELVPDRADAILARGIEFGQSRIVCGVHWQSDVDAGRLIGAAVVARLHGNEQFMDALQAARQEVATAGTSGAERERACESERAALSGAASSDVKEAE